MKNSVSQLTLNLLYTGFIFILFSCAKSKKTNPEESLTITSLVNTSATLEKEPKNYTNDQNGCLVWNPNAQPNDKAHWSGACKNGYANGKGTLKLISDKVTETYKNITLTHGKVEGSTIVKVEYFNEKPCETCIVQFNGIYKNGNPISGTLSFGNGKTKKLPFVKSQNGCLVWALNATGDTHINWSGGCKNNFANGKGTLQISSPRGTEVYKNGTLKNGIMQGYAEVTLKYNKKPCKTCVVQFSGIYKNASPINGTFLLANGKEIKLSYVEDQNGCLVWNPEPKPNEKITWTGNCINGYANGEGILTYLNNDATETLKGIFKNGMLQGKGSIQIDYKQKCDTCIVDFVGIFKNHEPIEGSITFGNGMTKQHKTQKQLNAKQLDHQMAKKLLTNEIVRRTVNSSFEYYTYGNLSSGISSPLHY